MEEVNNKCKRCHRKLKTETSLHIGYGPTCAKKEGFIIKKGEIVAKRLDKLK